MSDLTFELISSVAKIFLVINVLMVSVALMTWIERRLSSMIQFRLGPNRVVRWNPLLCI